MIIILADDFSGAAEIGGIGLQNGLRSGIQFDFDPATQIDLLVIDTNTRTLSESDTIKKIYDIACKIEKSGVKSRIFKKVDSVFRGHIITEINILHLVLGFTRVLLFPANPSKGRTIKNRQYYIDNIPLHETVFVMILQILVLIQMSIK